MYYKELFRNKDLQILKIADDVDYNCAYFRIVLASENQLIQTMNTLKINGVNPRRYFYPALNTLSYIKYQSCPIAEDLANRVMCLPLYYDLAKEDQSMIANIILEVLK